MSIKIAKENDDYRLVKPIGDTYSDFSKSFLPNPNTGQIGRKTNIDSVKQALRNLILTNKYERLRNPEFGTRLARYTFENFDDFVEDEIADEIENAVNRFEPRVRLLEVNVSVNQEEKAIYVYIEFATIFSKETSDLELVLYRVR